MAKNVEAKGLDELIKGISDICESIDGIEAVAGKKIVEEGKPLVEKLELKINRLSQSEESAINEATYLKSIKTTGKVDNNKEQVDRIVRDILGSKAQGKMKELF